MTQSSHVEVSDSAEERLSEVFLKTKARSADLDANYKLNRVGNGSENLWAGGNPMTQSSPVDV